MKLFTTNNTTKASKNIKKYQAVAIQKEQAKALKGGTIVEDILDW